MDLAEDDGLNGSLYYDAPLPDDQNGVEAGIRAIRQDVSRSRQRADSPPSRLTPMRQRLRAHSQPASQSTPSCGACGRSDARQKTIRCVRCHLHFHAVKCAGFASLNVARRASFYCTSCATPTSSLPFSPTPPVTNHVVVHGDDDDDDDDGNIDALSQDLFLSRPSSPLFLPWNPPLPPPLPSQDPPIPTPPAPLPSQPPPPTQPFQPPLPSQAFVQPPPPSQPDSQPDFSFSLEDICSTRLRVLRHCPKSSRGKFKNLLRVVFSDVARDYESVHKWTRAFSVAKLVLFVPPGRKIFKDKAAVVDQRISAFLDGRLDELWAQATAKSRRQHQQPSSRSATNIRRATWLAQEGQFRQAAKALTSHGLDFDSAEALGEMQRKHPASPPASSSIPLPPPPPYRFNSSEVHAALNSFHSATAAGPSGLRAAHLKDAFAAKNFTAGHQLIDVMTDILNIVVAGKAPSAIAPYLCGENLFAANKKSGGHRPIAVGETIRRWAAKCLARKAIEDVRNHFAPHQLGVGVKGGCEALIHAANTIFNDNTIPLEEKWVLQIDMENAFNSIDRVSMLKETREHCPQLSAWADYCYGRPSILFFGEHKLSSSSGSQQGDPLSIILFSLVLQPLINRIKDSCPNLRLNGWILDDGTLIGPKDDLQRAYDIFATSGPAVGLLLNASKSRVWCGASHEDNPDPLDRNIPRSQSDGYDLLGAPVGDISFSRKVIDDRILKIAEIFDRLPDLNDCHVSFSLLRYCFSLPKFSYCLRTCDPSHLLPSYRHFDSLQYSTLSLLIGQPIGDDARIQACLPLKLGGVGLRSAESHCSAAFIASVAHSRPILDTISPLPLPSRSLDPSFHLLQTATGNPTFSSLDLLPADFTQNSLSKLVDSHSLSSLLASADLRDCARLHSLNLPHAGAFLDAIPSPSLNLHLDSRIFGKALSYRLGLPLMPSIPCPSDKCDKQLDDKGDHAMHCRDDHGIRGGRHDRIRDQVFQEAQRAGFNPKKEMPALIPGSQSRPADVFVEQWIDGKRVAFDVSVISPTQDACIDRAATIPATAIEMRKSEKIRKHFENCRASGLHFEPLVVETFGGWDPGAVKTLKAFATQCASRKGIAPAIEIKQFFQRLSVSLQRGNATLLLCRDTNSV